VAEADGLDYLPRLLGLPARGRSAFPVGRRGAAAGRPRPAPASLGEHLLRGTVDADYPASGGYVLHLYHFHHPWSHRGYGGVCLSAATVVEDLVKDALRLWRAEASGTAGPAGGRVLTRGPGRAAAAYELGRAAHLLADCWVPHHAAGVAGCGHGAYEAWLEEGGRWREFAPSSGGAYRWQAVYRPGDDLHGVPHVLDWRNVRDWVDLAAHEALPWYDRYLNACRHPGYEEHFAPAAARLVPAAVRHLAGFLHLFFTLAVAAPGGEEEQGP
jgi:hypothetical protein